MVAYGQGLETCYNGAQPWWRACGCLERTRSHVGHEPVCLLRPAENSSFGVRSRVSGARQPEQSLASGVSYRR